MALITKCKWRAKCRLMRGDAELLLHLRDEPDDEEGERQIHDEALPEWEAVLPAGSHVSTPRM
jgi:hypothetical protein